MGKKSNPFDDNPFGKFDDGARDPFQDQTVPPADSGPWPADRGSAWGSSAQPATIPLDSGFGSANGGEIQMDYAKRKETLDLKEKELNAREEELRKQRQELEASGLIKPKKNWPRCYPITNHDINGEVPPENRWMVRYCYWGFLGFLFAVTWNWFAALLAMCVISSGLAGFLLATIYWFAGVPGAWILWYMRIYNLAIRDRALVYAWFFLMFLIHIAFCVCAAISPPLPVASNWSLTGFIPCIKAFNKSNFIGVLYVMGAVFWSLESVWCIWALIAVYSHFRSGSAPRRMKQEAAGAIASRAVSGNTGKKNFGAGDV